MESLYEDNSMKYPLTKKEIIMIDKVWDLIDIFRETKITRNRYERYIIGKIKLLYTKMEYYVLEIIIEKMYWNLVYKVMENFNLKFEIFFGKKKEIEDIKKNILKKNININNDNINKICFIYKNKIVYKYNYPNDLDLITFSIMINRELYESIMMNKINIEIPPYNNIIEFDYMFANINTLIPFVNNKKKRLKKIKELYF